MSLNTDPYGINNISATGVSGKRVKVTVDGEDLGTAAEVVVNSQIFGEDSPSVDLKDLTGLADVSFYGHVYRDLRKTNKELEKKVRLADQVADSRGEDTAYWHNAYEVAAKKATERYMEITRLTGELRRKVKPIDAPPLSTADYIPALQVRNERIAELTAEVERLKQSLKEQDEKHKQKQANLQANFEQNAAGQEKVRFLKKENSSLKRENAFKQERNRELVAELQKLMAERDEATRASDARGDALNHITAGYNRLFDERDGGMASADFWYEKYLGAQEIIESQGDRIEDLVRGSNSLVESINGVSAIVDEAAEYWNEKAGD